MKERKMLELLNKIKNLLKDEGLNKHQRLYDEIDKLTGDCPNLQATGKLGRINTEENCDNSLLLTILNSLMSHF